MIVGLDTKPALKWTGNVATGDDGTRYVVAEVAQYITADGSCRRDVFLVWRQEDAALRYRVSVAATLDAAKAIAELDYARR